MHRVVVTGMGVVAPNGVGCNAFREALQRGTSAVRPFSRLSSGISSWLAAEIPPALFSLNGVDRHITYGLMAVEESLTDSGLDLKTLDPERIGVVFSSSKGGMESFERGIAPALMYNFPTSSASSAILSRYPFRGPVLNIVAACATGTHTVIRGVQLIEDGYATAVVAGASDASLTPLLLSGYEKMGVLSRRGVFPFDRFRDGFVVGEGSCALILEERTHALRRGASSYGEITGYAMGQDPFHPLRFENSEGSLARVMTLALRRSRVPFDGIGYINAHGTGTVAGDLYETEQLKRAFGETAYRIPVSATKSMTGHLLGAAGTVELAACLLAMKEGFVPPTVGLTEKDPACDLDYVPNVARKKKISTALSISMGFGGHIGVIVIKK